MNDRFLVSKTQAATRQLRLAIKLLFDGADSVPVHTLVGAASVILSDYIEKKAPNKSWDIFAQQANKISAAEYFRVMRKAQNFFKHAESDPDAILDFEVVDTDNLAFWAVLNSAELWPLSKEEEIFRAWYLSSYFPDLDKSCAAFREALSLFGDLRSVSRDSRLAIGRKVLLRHLV